MGTPYLGEIKIVPFNFAPRGWAECNGQLMQINQNQALFALFGTTYGGDGRVTFALPNLRGRVPLHMNNGFAWGQAGGEPAHTLSIPELPQHIHPVTANSTAVTDSNPVGNYWGNGGKAIYGPTSNTAMAPQAIGNVGGSQAHDNMTPYLTLNFIVALQGIFPSQS